MTVSVSVFVIVVVIVAAAFGALGIVIGEIIKEKKALNDKESAQQQAKKIINDALAEAESSKLSLLKLKKKFTNFVQTQTKKFVKDETKFSVRKRDLISVKSILTKELTISNQRVNI